MHFKSVTVIAILAHATQSFAAPVPASYNVQDLMACGDKDKKPTLKQVTQAAANSVPNAVLNAPLKSNAASLVQTTIKAIHQPNQPGPSVQAPR